MREARDAVGEHGRAARAVDRAVHASPATHRPVGGVHDGVDHLLGDVAPHDREVHGPMVAHALLDGHAQEAFSSRSTARSSTAWRSSGVATLRRTAERIVRPSS